MDVGFILRNFCELYRDPEILGVQIWVTAGPVQISSSGNHLAAKALIEQAEVPIGAMRGRNHKFFDETYFSIKGRT